MKDKLLIAMLFVIILPIGIAQNDQSHPLSEIKPINTNLDMFKFNITNVSFVGINLTNPQYALDIVGDVRWSGTLQGGNVPWARLTSFPSSCSCPSGYAVQTIGSNCNCIPINATQGVINGSGIVNYIPVFTGVNTIDVSPFYLTSNNLNLGQQSLINALWINASYLNISAGFVVLPSGNVGIGTTAPNSVLHVYRPGAGDNHSVIQAEYGVDAGRWTKAWLNRKVDWENWYALYLASNVIDPILVAKYNGNVGIGTTSPVDKLQVNGNLNMSGGENAIVNVKQIRGRTSDGLLRLDVGPPGKSGALLINYDTPGDVIFYGGAGTGADVLMSIKQGGNVGIGTISPASFAKLHVEGDVYLGEGGTQYRKIRWDDNTAYHWIGYDSSALQPSWSSSGWWMKFNTHSNEGFIFGNPTDGILMAISGSTSGFPGGKGVYINGNVGIGTTSPDAKLRVAGGDIRLDGGASIRASGRLHIQSDEDLYLNPWSGNTLVGWGGGPGNLYVAGNVGIGTTAPSGQLDVSNSFYTRTGEIVLRAQDGTNEGGQIYFTGAGTNRYFYLDNYAGRFRFVSQDDTGESEKFTITNAGNVGIGIINPQVKLDVAGDIGVRGSIKTYFKSLDNLGTVFQALVGTVGGYQHFHFLPDYSAPPGSTDRTVYFGFNSNITQYAFMSTAPGSNTQLFTIKGDTGNVGIGTTSPAYKLDVAGDIRATGTIYGTIRGQYGGGLTGGGTGITAYYYVGSLPYSSVAVYQKLYIQVWGGGSGAWDWYGSGIDEYVISTRDALKVYRSRTLGETLNYQLLIYNNTATSQYDVYVAVVSQDYPNILIRSFKLDAPDYWVEQPIIQQTPSGTDVTSSFEFVNTIITDRYGNVGIGTNSPQTKLHVEGGWLRVSNAGLPNSAIQLETQNGFHRIAFNQLRFWDWDISSDMVTFENGNVGIGTTTPNAKLHIMSSGESIYFGSGTVSYPTTPSAGSGNIVGKGSTSDFRIAIQDGTGRVNMYWNAYYDASAGTHKYLVSNEGANRLLMSAGDFGFFVAPTGTAGNAISWTNAMYITNSGNVGIGTTTPDTKLVISGGGTVKFYANSVGDIQFSGSARPHFASGDFSVYEGQVGSGTLRFQIVSGGNTYLVPNGGNVGIGTTSPAYELDVRGSSGPIVNIGSTSSCCAGSNPTLAVSEDTLNNNRLPWIQFHASGYQEAFIRLNKDTRVFEMGDDQGIGVDLALLNGSGVRNVYLSPRGTSYFMGGNVGIGTTTPSAKLSVVGNVYLLDNGGLNAFEIKLSGVPTRRGLVLDPDPSGRVIFYGHSWQTNSQFEFRNALDDSTVMTIKTTGNVGIGTTSPSSKLEVYNGDIEINDGQANGTYKIKGLRVFYAGDETQVSTTSTTPELKKQFTAVFDDTYGIKPRYINIIAKIWNSGGYTTSLNVTLQGCGGTVLSTASTSPTLVKGWIDVSGCGNNYYPTGIYLSTSNAGGVAYNDLIEFYYVE